MGDLEKWFRRHRGRRINKWQHYFEVYERHLERYRGRPFVLVEVGVNHGGSLDMWRHYFGPEVEIHGVDIKPDCLSLEEDGFTIHIGDQTDRDFLARLRDEIPTIDVLIDDGGHTMEQQKATFDVLFPHVADDGVFIVEDMHTSYWDEFGGGYRTGDSFVDYSKGLIDDLHGWHGRDDSPGVTAVTRSAHSLHYYDSMLVIEKRPMVPPVSTKSGHGIVTRRRAALERLPQPVGRAVERAAGRLTALASTQADSSASR